MQIYAVVICSGDASGANRMFKCYTHQVPVQRHRSRHVVYIHKLVDIVVHVDVARKKLETAQDIHKRQAHPPAKNDVIQIL
jgi:hypothetical protein